MDIGRARERERERETERERERERERETERERERETERERERERERDSEPEGDGSGCVEEFEWKEFESEAMIYRTLRVLFLYRKNRIPEIEIIWDIGFIHLDTETVCFLACVWGRTRTFQNGLVTQRHNPRNQKCQSRLHFGQERSPQP
jgi:hypothetical protein